MNRSFGKDFKLCNSKHIDSIFEESNTLKQYPFVARFKSLELKSEKPLQFVISAPKRTFKTAIQRNRIKRITREAVRNNKSPLETWLVEKNMQVGIFLLYTAKEEMSSEKLNRKAHELFRKIIDDLERNHA